jgi:nucleoside transporter
MVWTHLMNETEGMAMKSRHHGPLSVMMFLQYAVWGAWLPLAARYLSAPVESGGLGFSGGQIGMILGLAGSIGAVSAPFIAGQFADRYFSTERFLAALLLLGGGLQFALASQTSYGGWLVLSVLYSVIYMPTLSLSNSLAFAHIEDQEREFPRLRVWGTIGWIAASWVFPWIWLQTDLHFTWMPPFLTGQEVPDVVHKLAWSLRFSGMMSLGYAAFCLLLPHTPPRRDAVEKLAFAKAFGLFRHPSFALLVLVSLPISMIHQIYFLQTSPFLASIGIPTSSIGPAMTIGQFAEIGVMALLGMFLTRLGFKWTIVLGALAYAARFGIFGMNLAPAVTVASLVLHGFCYACFFASAFIYVEKLASADVRHSAQTVFGIIILGGGPVLGGKLSGYLQARFTEGAVFHFGPMWLVLAGVALATAVVVAVGFRDETGGAKN